MCNLLTRTCCECKTNKPVIFFPIYNPMYDLFGAEYINSYLLECFFCRYRRSDERRDDDYTLHNPSALRLYADTNNARKHKIVKLEELCELCGKHTGKPAKRKHHPMGASPYLTVSLCNECDNKIHPYKIQCRKRKKKGERVAVKPSENRTASLAHWGIGINYAPPPIVRKDYWEYYAEVIKCLSQPNSPEFDLYKDMFIYKQLLESS